MREMHDIQEGPEKKITKPSEKQIETFDDLRSQDKSEKINTFDSIRKQESDRPVKTFGDFREGEGVENKIKGIKDTPEVIEQKRMSQAVEDIGKIDWMEPEKWKNLDIVEKRAALNQAGRALMKAYHHPNPPLFTEKAESNIQGEYGDGWAYNKTAGSDYGIRMNEEGINQMNKKLFGDDPRVALKTYTHEFRHSYQCEQAHAFDKGLEADNPNKAKEWSGNLGENYKPPPDKETAKTDPEEYNREYEAYKNQPVERDADEFGEKLSSKIYGEIEKR